MAAQLAALNNYVQNTLLIGDANVRNAINGQGLQAFDDFITLTKEDITEICMNERKPGGTIANPAQNPVAVIAGVPPTIPNPGVLIGHIFEKRLKMLCNHIHHLRRIQRNFTAASATSAWLTFVYCYKEQEDKYDNEIDLPEKLTSVEDIRIMLKNLDDYLLRKRGTTGIPLAASMRPNIALLAGTPEDPDHGFGNPSIQEEMIRRASHTGNIYTKDNHLVWMAIRHVTHEGPRWSWVQQHSRTQNGCAAYISLNTHYLGDAFQARLRARADQMLESIYYDGTKRNFTYEKYTETLQKAFTDLEATGETVS